MGYKCGESDSRTVRHAGRRAPIRSKGKQRFWAYSVENGLSKLQRLYRRVTGTGDCGEADQPQSRCSSFLRAPSSLWHTSIGHHRSHAQPTKIAAEGTAFQSIPPDCRPTSRGPSEKAEGRHVTHLGLVDGWGKCPRLIYPCPYVVNH